MDLETLIEKLYDKDLTEKKENEIVEKVIAELDELRDTEPEQYNKLLQSLNRAIEEIDVLMQ